MALSLLHKTQSAKNLGELNTFLRTFMLDEPDTFAVAQRLVSEFVELDQAHQTVVTARSQIALLQPAHEQLLDRQRGTDERSVLQRTRLSLEPYTEHRRASLLQAGIAELNLKIDQSAATREQSENHKVILQSELDSLEQQHRESGGDAITRLENEKLQLERSKTDKVAKLEQADKACRSLGWKLPDNAEDFVTTVSNARDLLNECVNRGDEWRQKHFDLNTRKTATENDLKSCRIELASLRKSPSNIPANMQELRRVIASAIGVHEESLPFAGELIEIREDEMEWRGVIERVLHNLGLSLLVEEKHYNSLTNYVNNTHLGARIVYIRTGQTVPGIDRNTSFSSMFNKLRLKGSSHSTWLENELKRINHECVSSVQALKSSELAAMTKEGLIKSSKFRHEKDDRRNINDRRSWILGFDNREKIAIYENEEKQLISNLKEQTAALEQLVVDDQKRGRDMLQYQTLNNLQWQEIDITPLIERLARINEQLQSLRNDNANLLKLGEKIKKQKERLEKLNSTIADLGSFVRERVKERDRLQSNLDEVRTSWGNHLIEDAQRTELQRRFGFFEDTPTLATLDRFANKVDKTFENDIAALEQCINDCKQKIERAFADFKRTWPLESANMDDTIDSANDYVGLLRRLENDNLPKFEENFYELLRTQSNQNLAALNTHISQAKKQIYERMDLVNTSLRRANFNPGTFLQIVTTDRNLAEVKEFRQSIANILSQAWTGSGEESEARFATLRAVVKRLSSEEWADKHWKAIVLDVRQHVEFVGQEIDPTGREIETYRSGAGKSGGQRQKLATTCLAAALHYQLSRGEEGIPSYAAVVLDEAFDKADHEFTAIAMNIFNEFGFQMIVATPIKSVMTLESFIGGACFVDIRDRKYSTHLPILYDTETSRLKLSEDVRRDVESELTVS